MAYVREKWIPGEDGKQYGPYFYLVQSVRKGNKVTQKHIKYLGKFGSAMEATAYAVQEYGPEMMDAQSDAPLGTTRAIFSENVVPKSEAATPVVPKEDASERVVPKTVMRAIERLRKLDEEFHAARHAEHEALQAVLAEGDWKDLQRELEDLKAKGSKAKAAVARRKKLDALFGAHIETIDRSQAAETKAVEVYDRLSTKHKQLIDEQRTGVLAEGLRTRRHRKDLAALSDLLHS